MKTLLLALAVLLCGTANAGCVPLNEEDEKWFIASNIAIFADWQTTRDIVRQADKGYYEAGPIAKRFMGTHPTYAGVDSYMAARFLVNYYMACKLENTEWRHTYLVITTVSHGSAAANNYNIGLRIRF
jgi:hypothetical protein